MRVSSVRAISSGLLERRLELETAQQTEPIRFVHTLRFAPQRADRVGRHAGVPPPPSPSPVSLPLPSVQGCRSSPALRAGIQIEHVLVFWLVILFSICFQMHMNRLHCTAEAAIKHPPKDDRYHALGSYHSAAGKLAVRTDTRNKVFHLPTKSPFSTFDSARAMRSLPQNALFPSEYYSLTAHFRRRHCQADDDSDVGEAKNLSLILPLAEIISASCLGCHKESPSLSLHQKVLRSCDVPDQEKKKTSVKV